MGLFSEQSMGFDLLKTGNNAFVTGGAGVGKSFLIRYFIHWACTEAHKNVMVTAPTGIAATMIGGVTLARAFEIPIGALTYTRKSYAPSEEIIKADIIIIDEISMCRMDTFDFIANKILDANYKRKHRGLPTIQLIVVGDFYQLPPVVTQLDKSVLDKYYDADIGLGYAFQSQFWDMFDFNTIMLTEVIRQDQQDFIENLNLVRTGNKAYIDQIASRTSKHPLNGITICGTNSEVNDINKIYFDRIPNTAVQYTAIYDGEADEFDTIADRELLLKVGARVLIIANSPVNEQGYLDYYNGQFGTVVGLYNDAVAVKLDNGVTVPIKPFVWDVYNYVIEKDDFGNDLLTKKIVGHVIQYPIKLGYAISIHKSQGQTYDSVNLSPYCWECGQLYVAMSRVKKIENLYFNYSPDVQYVVTSLNVIKFYNKMLAKQNNYTVKPVVSIPSNDNYADLLKAINNINTVGG